MASSIMDNREYKLSRTAAPENGEEISRQKFNLILGLTLAWGVLLDIALAVFAADLILQIPVIAVLIGYFVVSFGCIFIIYKSENPVVSFSGFTGLALAMGVLLVFCVQNYAQQTILDAFVGTGLITILMMCLSTLFPNFFSKLGGILFTVLIGLILIEVVSIFAFGYHPGWLNIVAVIIFCGYIGYDWWKTSQYIPTVDRAIDSAADIYVDIVNLFIRLLAIFGNARD